MSSYEELVLNREVVDKWMERYGVRFGIYKHGSFKEQLFPFDAIPRIITNAEWKQLEAGLRQRVQALNFFLSDIYTHKLIIKDGVVPEEFVYSSKGYLPQCEGVLPTLNVYSHISGIDLVQATDKTWYILEDNLRIPSGASYPLIARELTRKTSPNTFEGAHIADNRNYPAMLKHVMDDVNTCEGIEVVLTPGRYNSAFFEHSYLAEKAGVVLAFPDELFVEDDKVYYKSLHNTKARVGVVYRRISDDFMDPMTFNRESLLGVPNIFNAYRKGNVSIINAFGNGVADDKGIYYFVPKMIKYYLNEEPILRNAPTYLPMFADDQKYVLSNLKNLVIKDVAEAGGYGVMFGKDMTAERLTEVREMIIHEPRRWIAQEVIDFIDLNIMSDDGIVKRKSDLRAFVLTGKDAKVWPSGLTRFTRDPNSLVVNSSQGGGFKDTWVMTE